MKSNTIDLSINIVHYNTLELTTNCLQSIISVKKNTDYWEIIVVDNGSTDESGNELKKIFSEKQFPYIHFLQEKSNGGFSKGNNEALKESKGEYILLLNSDTEITRDSIIDTLAVFRDEQVGAATCKLVLPNGEIDPACHRGFPRPWASISYFVGLERLFPKIPFFSGYHQWYKDLSSIHEIDSPSGAFFMIRKKLLEKVGFLDEDYFMYGEDLDWAYRIKEKGYKILYVPTGKALHIKKQSGRENLDKVLKVKTQKHFYETMQLFYRKHFQKQYPWYITGFIYGLLNIRLLILNIFKK